MSVYWLQPEEAELQVIPQTSSSKGPIPDFSQYKKALDKKKAFFAYLRPEVEAQNAHVLRQREFIHGLKAKYNSGEMISKSQMQELKWLAREYRTEHSGALDLMFKQLLTKVDIVPVELVLVQAANESAWGTSRFATQGYNFFGLWCFKKGCGFVPKSRVQGAEHEVAKFSDLSSATYTYIRNLNRHYAYREMRAIRQQLRSQMKPISAVALSEGLTKYSERGDDYVVELKQMIRINRDIM